MKNKVKLLYRSFFLIIMLYGGTGHSLLAGPIFDDATISKDVIVDIYDRFDLSISFTEIYDIPYDPNQIDFVCELTSPSGKTYTQDGFYYIPMNASSSNPDIVTLSTTENPDWRIRFSPKESGTWQFRLKAVDSDETDYLPNSGYYTFLCTSNSNNKGPLKLADKKYLRHENGDFFFPVSMNYAWWQGDTRTGKDVEGIFEMEENITKLSNMGVDLIRFYLNTNSSMGIIGYDMYYDKYFMNFMNQFDSWRLDYLLEHAEIEDMYVIFSLFDHAVFENSDKHNFWSDYNPFNSNSKKEPYYSEDSKGDCVIASDIFNTGPSDDSFRIIKNYIRYVLSRWGYSSHLFSIETFNEPDQEGPNYKLAIGNWQEEVYNYIKLT